MKKLNKMFEPKSVNVVTKVEKARTNNYVCHRAIIITEKDDSDTIIGDCIKVVSETNK